MARGLRRGFNGWAIVPRRVLVRVALVFSLVSMSLPSPMRSLEPTTTPPLLRSGSELRAMMVPLMVAATLEKVLTPP